MALKYDYDIDWEKVIRVIMPDAKFTGKQHHRNESAYKSDIVWTDTRPKPTWEQIAAIWTNPFAVGTGVRTDRNAPGDYKISAMPSDHYQWLMLDPDNGRVLIREDYPILFHVIGTSFNHLYPGITADQFGLPKPGGRTMMIAGDGKAIGHHGGSNANVLTVTLGGGGNNPKSETQPYWVAGNAFIFAGELRYG